MPVLASALTVADALQQPVWTALPDAAVSYVNPYWCSYTGLHEAESLGNGWMDAVHPDDIPQLMAQCTISVANGTSYEIEFRFRRADGVWRRHLARVVSIRDETGAVIGWVGSATDVDDQRRAEEELRASEARARAIVEHVGDLVYTLDIDGTIRAVNPAVERVLGYRREELIGRLIDTLIVPDQLPRQEEALDRKLAGQEDSTYDIDLVAKDGGSITVAVARETRNDGNWAVLTIRDEGVGIPRADLPYVFERYRRGSNVGWRTKGTGIGLAGVRQIVEQHGGTVTAESSEGRGSTFTVRLPLGLAHDIGMGGEEA